MDSRRALLFFILVSSSSERVSVEADVWDMSRVVQDEWRLHNERLVMMRDVLLLLPSMPDIDIDVDDTDDEDDDDDARVAS